MPIRRRASECERCIAERRIAEPARRPRQYRLALLGALIALAVARQGLAASVAARVEWDAPAGCAGALELHARLSQLLGHEPETLGKLSRVRGSVVRTAKGFRLVLEAFERDRRSSRVFEAARCDDLAETAALAVALAIAPERAGGAGGNEGGSDVTAPSDPGGERDVAVGSPGTTAAAGNGRGAAAGDAGATRAANAASGARSVRGFAAAHALIERGALPRLTPGVAVGAGASRGALSIAAQGALFGAQSSSVAPDQAVEFDLVTGGVRGCWALRDNAPRLNGCACFEAGRYRGLGLGLAPSRDARDLWLAAGAALDAQWPLSPALAVELRAEPMLPLLRKQYTINGSEDVHAPSALSTRLYLGLVLTGG